MRYPILLITLLTFSIYLYGVEISVQQIPEPAESLEEVTDSIPTYTDLDELVVTGASAFHVKDGTAYVPAKETKKFSYSAQSLLERMAIPTLKTDLSTGEIKRLNGEDVNYYIDYLPASASDCKNLNPQDVERVEVLDFPSDPRFQGNRNVVNFIMRQYAYGGYAKAYAYYDLWRNMGFYELYDKSVYKAMTYDVTLGYNQSGTHDGHCESSADYMFPEGKVNVTTDSPLPIVKSRSAYGAIKALYRRSNGLTLTNTLGFTASPAMTNTSHQDYRYSPAIYPDGYTETDIRNGSLSVYWNGQLTAPLSDVWQILVEPNVKYNSQDYNRDFRSSSAGYSYDVKEKLWNANIFATITRKISQGSLTLAVAGGMTDDRMHYSGSTNQDVAQNTVKTGLHFWGTHYRPNFNIFYRVGGVAHFLKNDNIRRTYLLPWCLLYVNYTPRHNHALSLNAYFTGSSNELSQLNPAQMRTSSVDILTGNPGLKPTNTLHGILNYQWTGHPVFGIGAYLTSKYAHRPVTPNFTPVDADGPAMLQSYTNTGYMMLLGAGVNVSASLLQRSLTFSMSAAPAYYRNGGYSLLTQFGVPVTLQAQYYLRNFTFGAGMMTPQKYLGPGFRNEAPWYYSLSAGYSTGNLNLFLKFSNFANSSWVGPRFEQIHPNYHYEATDWFSGIHRYITFTLTYTLRYGKPINREAELTVDKAINSGIRTK